MSTGPEFIQVEQPLIDQLVSMGWKFTTGNLINPTATGRETFRDVLLLDDLRQALVRINVDDRGRPWLDNGRVGTAVSALQRVGAPRLMEANKAATEILLKGVPVEGLPEWDGGRTQTVRFFDWDNPDNNTFRVINQFKVEEPGGQAHRHIIPDLALFVNGIPLVVVEAKSPYLPDPLTEAIGQLQRYSNQRYWVEGNEGNERLFYTNQFMVATCFEQARVGTIGAMAHHFMEWKDTAPVPMKEVAQALGKEDLSRQETLVAGMLHPAHLLDIIRHFVLFTVVNSRTIKIVARYQQFRAVHGAVQRLLTGKTKVLDGEHDRRGGIIWHTQGSGKSLTMVFLVRKMRNTPALRKFKVVVVTDRKDLQKQLSDTAELSGETVKIAKKIAALKTLLAEKGPGLVFAMIQKYQERDQNSEDAEDTDDDEAVPDNEKDVGEFPVLNQDESILVLVDEAHRSHASALHGNLMLAVPNCARIGFTGTPIIMGHRKRTHEIFGAFIDQYRLKESEEDGATVPILYEGMTTAGAVKDGRDLDELFEDMLHGWSKEDLERIKAKYATKGHVMEAPMMIEAKARNMLRHYVQNVLPNGFKAQVVAVSRRAAVRYHDAFLKVRDTLVAQVAGLPEGLVGLADDEMGSIPDRTRFLIRAQRHLDDIRQMEFAVVISGTQNDEVDPTGHWTDGAKVAGRIEAFKRPYPTAENADPQKTSRLGFLIVKSMLLTGFDAPVEQVLYLDRHMKEAELLQAIARVNRPNGEKKTAGYVVDYYGVARHLKEALAVYAAEDIEGALQSLKDEIPKLRDRHYRVVDLFDSRDVDLDDTEECVELLADEKLRAEFHVLLKSFLATLDLVLPRPEALPYVKDAKRLANIQVRARNRYRSGERPIGAEVGAKVRKLIDDHIISLGVDPKIAPMAISDAKFDEHLDKHRSSKAKASEMEHALRYHIRKRMDEDPELFEALSKRLDRILSELKDRWDALEKALRDFTDEVRAGRQQDDTGLDPETQVPFLGVLRQELAKDGEVTPDVLVKLVGVTVDLVAHVQQEIRLVGFWKRVQAQDALRSWIVQCLDDREVLPYSRLPEVADRLVELAKVNHHRLVK
jgi:type I restriction enzyme R subunit